MKYLFSILLFLFAIITSYAQTENSETIPRGKVIFNVNAVVNATVQYENDETRINENLNLQLVETVEYNIVNYNGEGKIINLEMMSHKNRMTASGQGSIIGYSEGICLGEDNYTYSIDPEVSSPQAGIFGITAGKPYKIQIYFKDFYRYCNGSASGTSKYVSGWEGDAPTFETVPIKKEQFYVSSAVRGIFESPEDIELAMKGEMTALQRKLQGTFTPREDGGFFTSGKVSHSYNYKDEIGMVYNGTITISWSVQYGDLPKDDSQQIILSGCTQLVLGEQTELTAKASAEGGSYRFWAEPEEMFIIETNGATAKIMGSSPGSGTLNVEYTHTDGKIAKASQAAACVQVESYNSGEAIPQIAFYDVDGKKKSGIITVPVTAQPGDAAELVTFEPADPSVLSAEGMGNKVTLQGITTGKTTLQASTKCGAETGPAVEVEVVNCDDETVVALERMRKVAMEALLNANDELRRIARSEKYEKAKEEIVGSLKEMLAKAALTIVTSGKSPTVAIEAASNVAEAGTAISEMIASGSQTEFYENAIKTAVGKLAGSAASAASGVIDVQKAAQKFGDNWAQLRDYEISLKNALERFEKADKDLQKYIRLQQICSGEKPKPPRKDVSKTESKPKPEPVKSKPPAKPTAKPDEQPAQEPQPSEPTAEDEVPLDPDRPVTPPRQVGLPYESDDCGCNNSKALTVGAEDFSTLSTGIQNLSNCVKNFESISLNDYQMALQELSTLTDSLSTTLETDAIDFLTKAKEWNPRLDSIVARIKAYDEAGNVFLKNMDKCPESLTTGMELFQSVEKVTIEMVKTKY